MSAGDDKRMAFIAFAAEDGQASQVKQVERVGVELLVGEADAEQVKIAKGPLRFQRI